MSLPWIIILVFAAIALFVYSGVILFHDLFHYRALVRERLDGLTIAMKGDANASLFRDLKQFEADLSRARTDWRTRLRDMLEQGDIRSSIATLALISLFCSAVLAAVCFYVSKRWWLAPVGLSIGLLAPWLYVRAKCQWRMRRLALQLPEAFDAISRAVRAGQTSIAAFQIVADDFESPLADEFRRCYDEQSLGIARDAALRILAVRTGIMELRIFVVALLMQSRSGGNLTELLSNLSMLVRKRVKLQQRIKALTGEGRVQATVLIVLPTVAFAALHVISPNYIACLLDRPWLVATALAAQAVGALWIRQIVNVAF